MEAILSEGTSGCDRVIQPVGKRRALGFFLAAVILATVTIAVLLTWSALDFFSGIDHLARAPIPGAVSVTVQRADEIVVYYEGRGAPSFDELRLRVRGPGGVTVAAKPYGLDLRYDRHNQVGTAVASFTAPAAGRYLISTTAAEPGARLAAGGDLGTGMMLTDAAGIGIGFAVFAAIAAVVALVLRRLKGSPKRRRADGDPPRGYRRTTAPLSFAD